MPRRRFRRCRSNPGRPVDADCFAVRNQDRRAPVLKGQRRHEVVHLKGNVFVKCYDRCHALAERDAPPALAVQRHVSAVAELAPLVRVDAGKLKLLRRKSNFQSPPQPQWAFLVVTGSVRPHFVHTNFIRFPPAYLVASSATASISYQRAVVKRPCRNDHARACDSQKRAVYLIDRIPVKRRPGYRPGKERHFPFAPGSFQNEAPRCEARLLSAAQCRLLIGAPVSWWTGSCPEI